MNIKSLSSVWVASGILWLAGVSAQAQQTFNPQIGYAFPAGGRRGETVEVLVGGQRLAGVTGAYVTGEGVEVVVGDYTRPLTNMQFNDLREKLTEAAKKLRPNAPAGRPLFLRFRDPEYMKRVAAEAGVTDKELKGVIAFALSRSDPKRQQNLQIAETVELKVIIDAQTEPGIRELRLLTPLGLTNPIRFVVGRLPEHREVEPNDASPDDLGKALPVVLNGQITPGDVDRFAFTARKGSKLVIAAAARELTPYLADAVPGWFQATVQVLDEKGREVAFADHNQIRQDPAMLFVVPKDGKYTLVVGDAIFRGREDFVYRVTVGEVPYVTNLFPLGGPLGKETTVQAFGWNLPSGPVKVVGRRLGTVDVAVGGQAASSRAPFAVDTLPEAREKEPNSDAALASPLKTPVIVNGKIDRAGDVDVYRFVAKAGSKFVAEVTARRLGSPLDSSLVLTDAAGKQVAANDDFVDPAAGMVTHQADSYLSAKLPSSGTYFLKIRDTQGKGGPLFGYRLRAGAPQPDFELRVVPAGVTVRAGTAAVVTVRAIRRDGFDGDVILSLVDPPEGFELAGGWIPGTTDETRVTISAYGSVGAAPAKLRILGQATIQGKEVRREAVAAEDRMQAFAYRHLVPVHDLLVAVLGRAARAGRFAMPSEPVRIPLGGTAEFRVGGSMRVPAGQIRLSLNDAPEGLTLDKAAMDASGVTITLRADKSKLTAGVKGNLIIDMALERNVPATAGRAATRRRTAVGVLPAVPFEVVG